MVIYPELQTLNPKLQANRPLNQNSGSPNCPNDPGSFRQEFRHIWLAVAGAMNIPKSKRTVFTEGRFKKGFRV